MTYNRLPLLKKCLPAIENQSMPVDSIVIVDNKSTDGTSQWLDDNYNRPGVTIYHSPENVGGAGGFEQGIRIAAEDTPDAIWIMDDDTIPTPDALRPLATALQQLGNKGGFACSRVLWTDGSQHLMNMPGFYPKNRPRCAVPDIKTDTRCDFCSFVSLLVPYRVVEKVGLPIGEFFIWHDDIEFTQRITRAGFRGIYVPESVVIHETASNRGASIIDAPAGMEKRFYYQIRNQMATKRLQYNPLKAYISNLLRLRRYKRKIKKRADLQREYLDAILRGYRDGKSFNPKIHYIK